MENLNVCSTCGGTLHIWHQPDHADNDTDWARWIHCTACPAGVAHAASAPVYIPFQGSQDADFDLVIVSNPNL